MFLDGRGRNFQKRQVRLGQTNSRLLVDSKVVGEFLKILNDFE